MSAIKVNRGAPGARILGIGGYRPRRRVTNDELAGVMETSDEWIQTRVGIAERRWAAEDETLVEMAVAAGTSLGSIRSRREQVYVSAGYDGVLAEWLVHEGDLVDAGDPIARLYPEVSA